MKRKRKVLADNRGSTLVESVCGLVILALVLVTMYSAFVVAQKILREGDIREKNGQAAFEAIEKQETDQEEELRLTLPIGGNSVSFSGRVVTAGETGKGARLYRFEPVTVSFEESLRNNYIYWLQELRKMTPQQRLEAGYTYSYINNSPFRNWLREYKYGGSWPTLSPDFLRRYLTPEEIERESKADGLFAKPVYVQPYLIPPVTSYDDTFIFAGFGQGDNWNTRLVYDHEERVWYYRLIGRDKSDIVNMTWPALKAMIHNEAEWRGLL